MGSSSFVRAGQYKSPVRVLAGIFLRSRETQARRSREKQLQIEEFRRVNGRLQQELDSARQQLAEQQRQIAELKIKNENLQKQPPFVPHDPVLAGHKFGPKMISVCVSLAKAAGLRASIECMKIITDWLGVDIRLPDWTTVRLWLMRLGVAALQESFEEADDWIWMVDHSNQIGQEKVLVIIGIRASNLPPPGTAIRHQDMRLLMLEPGTNWKTEDMEAAYERLAKKIGKPLAVITDGACELRDGAKTLQKDGRNTVVLRDFKHFAATVLKKVVGDDKHYADFTSQTGTTRSAIQQTELAHFSPVSVRPKARFMNLSATLKWANMILWHLSHANSTARKDIATKRMNAKLGWMRKYRQHIQKWSRCQDVVSKSLTFVNEQGLFRGATDQLSALLSSLELCDASQTVADRLLEFLREQELKLVSDHRVPLSTEILESCFGLYKQLERQHSKGGLTSLLAAFGSLLHQTTPERVREAFGRVTVKQTRVWVSENLGKTVTSKRKSAFAETKTTA